MAEVQDGVADKKDSGFGVYEFAGEGQTDKVLHRACENDLAAMLIGFLELHNAALEHVVVTDEADICREPKKVELGPLRSFAAGPRVALQAVRNEKLCHGRVGWSED